MLKNLGLLFNSTYGDPAVSSGLAAASVVGLILLALFGGYASYVLAMRGDSDPLGIRSRSGQMLSTYAGLISILLLAPLLVAAGMVFGKFVWRILAT
jgi:hypothetical protein